MPSRPANGGHVDVAFEGVCYDVPGKRERGFPIPWAERKRGKPKNILHNVTGHARSGEFLAVLGPSGSGKTSLLNVIAGRSQYPPKLGNVWFGGRPRTARTKRGIAYIMQDEVFFSNLTVRETLEFTAAIRIPDSVSLAQKMELVDRVVETLGLSKCQHTRIGNPQFDKGISGGERKRLNVANEMLHDPSVFLVDECTSGIDSASALNVIEMFHDLSRKGRTVVATIHQPSSRMFPLFDKVLLLSEGHVAYFGSPDSVASYFEAIDLPFPSVSYNPADYLLDLVTNGAPMNGSSNNLSVQAHVLSSWKAHGPQAFASEHQNYAASRAREAEETEAAVAVEIVVWDDCQQMPGNSGVESLPNQPVVVAAEADIKAAESTARPVQHTMNPPFRECGRLPVSLSNETSCPAEEGRRSHWNRFMRAALKRYLDISGQRSRRGIENKYPASWTMQFRYLARRSMRQKSGALLDRVSLAQLALVILIAAVCFFRIEESEETIDDRLGFLSFVCVFWALHSTLGALFTFPGEKQVLKKERSSGSYRLTAYYLAKTMTELPADMLYPTVFSVVLYFIVGLNPTFLSLLLFTITLTLNVNAAQSLGLLISAVLMDVRKAQVIGSLWVLFSMLVSGYYINPANFPAAVEPLRALSFIRYSYEALVRIELLDGRTFECSSGNVPHTVFSQSGSKRICPVTRDSLLRGAGLEGSFSIAEAMAVLIAWIAIARILAYFALKILHKP